MLSHALGVAGFEPVEVPLLLRLWHVDEIIACARDNPDPDILLITSATTADVIGAAASIVWANATIAAVGPTTSRRIQDLGFEVAILPEEATAESLVRALGDVSGKRIVYPRADLASS